MKRRIKLLLQWRRNQSEPQVKSQKERNIVASAEAAIVRNLVSNFVPPLTAKSFWHECVRNEAENKVIVDVERQDELEVEAQMERKVMIASAEAAVEKNEGSRIIPSGIKNHTFRIKPCYYHNHINLIKSWLTCDGASSRKHRWAHRWAHRWKASWEKGHGCCRIWNLAVTNAKSARISAKNMGDISMVSSIS